MSELSPEDFGYYQKMLLEKSGLSLAADKSYLLTTRLSSTAKNLGFSSLDAMTRDMRERNDARLINAVVEAMTTNETSFFRDTKPFENLKNLLPAIVAKQRITKNIRIWSAACSTGQEAYSIAMVMDEFLQNNPGWRCEIVGTDISEDVLKQAREGLYNQFEIQRGLTIQNMVKYFTQEGTSWRVNQKLRAMTQFKYLNLLDPMVSLGTFDIIFCRNVLIYFNAQTKTDVLSRIVKQLSPDGHIFLGACETAINLSVPLEAVSGQHGVLRPKKI